jgi:hypothetical protein
MPASCKMGHIVMQRSRETLSAESLCAPGILQDQRPPEVPFLFKGRYREKHPRDQIVCSMKQSSFCRSLGGLGWPLFLASKFNISLKLL